MKYRKKPVEIEAVELDNTYVSIINAFDFMGVPCRAHSGNRVDHEKFLQYCDTLTDGIVIKTLEGEHLASWGDMIIKGVKGEFYPCKPDIFLLTYDAI